MEIQELRIGNYVSLREDSLLLFKEFDVDTVQSLKLEGLVELFNDGNYGDSSYFKWFNLDIIYPIKLTGEFLLKLGFEKKEFNLEEEGYSIEYWIELDKNVYLQIFEDFSWGIEDVVTDDYIGLYKNDTFKYIHEVQNIYYDFTKKMLIFK